MPPINDWVNVAAVRSELPVIRQEWDIKGTLVENAGRADGYIRPIHSTVWTMSASHP